MAGREIALAAVGRRSAVAWAARLTLKFWHEIVRTEGKDERLEEKLSLEIGGLGDQVNKLLEEVLRDGLEGHF